MLESDIPFSEPMLDACYSGAVFGHAVCRLSNGDKQFIKLSMSHLKQFRKKAL